MNSIPSNISSAIHRICVLAIGVFSLNETTSYGLDAPSKQKGRQEAASSPKPEAAEEENLSTERIQCLVMDFSDQSAADICAALDEYISTETDPSKRAAAQYWKVRSAKQGSDLHELILRLAKALFRNQKRSSATASGPGPAAQNLFAG